MSTRTSTSRTGKRAETGAIHSPPDVASLPTDAAGREPGAAPRFSVVIPAYNAARTLPETLDSVFAQTCREYEIIVVDDGSTDRTPELLAGYGDRLQAVQKRNEGRPAAARNHGLAAARGDYIAFLDADDFWRPEKLARQLTLLDANPRLGLCFTATQVIDEAGGDVRISGCLPAARGRIYDLLTTRNVMVGSSVVARRSALQEVGGFDEGLTSIENWDLWIRVARDWEVDFVDEPLTVYRQHAGNRSVDVELRRRNIFRILEQHHDPADPSPAARARRRDAYFNAYFTVLGIGYFCRLEMGPARRAFWQAWRLKPSRDVFKHLLFATLGKRLFLCIRNLRRRLTGRAIEEEGR